MTGRRRAESRESPGGRAFGHADRVVRGPDRREFLRRYADLGAELEAVQHRASGREALIGRMKLELAARGVEA